jgi:hypothetical protein
MTLIGDTAEEFRAFDDADGAIVFFDHRGQGFDPVAGVDVADVADHAVLGLMDVAAHHAFATAARGQGLEMFLETRDEADGRLHLGLDGLGEGEVLLAAPGAPLVVEAVQVEEDLVADVADHGQPAHLDRHGVEGVAVDTEILAAVLGHVDVLFGELDAVEHERDQPADEVVVVAAQVDDLRAVLLRHLHDAADDGRMRRAPMILTLERPKVDDVAVEDELVAADAAQHVEELARLGVLGAQMEIREDQRPEVDLMLPRDLDGFFHGTKDYVTMVSVPRQVRLNKETERQGVGG